MLTLEELVTSIAPNFKYNAKTLASINGTSVEPSSVEPSLPPTAGDHGTLTGLGDDDHPQYLNNARGDARYPSVSYIDGSLAILKSYVDTEISYIEASINNTYDAGMWFVPEASFNDSYFKWVSGYLEPSIAGGGTGDVTKLYVDGSLAVRDARIAAINASLGDEDNILSYVNSSTYYDGSLNLRVLKSGDTMTGALTIEGDGDQYLILDNAAIGFAEDGAGYGDLVLGRWEPYFLDLTNWASGEAAVATVLRISANTTSGKEATLALVRGDWPDVEFLDLYNNGYVDSSNYGIRIQKRGTGIFRDFVIDSYDGSTYTNGINIKFSDLNDSETLTTDIYSDVSISGKTYLNGDIYAEGSIGFTGDVSAGASLRFRNGILIEVLSGGSKPPALNAIPTIYYKMDDTSGNIKDALGIYDSSSTDSLSYSQSGKINTAIGFDQDAGGATIPVENSIFDFSSDSSLSVSFWVKPKTNWDIDYTARLYLGSVYSDYGLTLAHNTTGNVTFRWRDPNNKKHSLVRDISLGTYYYLTFTKLGTELKFYVDASLAFTSSESTYSSYSPATWNLGQGIMGDIDEFALFLGTALTESDVSALYNNGDGLAYPFN